MSAYLDEIRDQLDPAHYSRSMTIVDMRAEDQPIVYATDAFMQLTGYARDEVIGRNCRFLQGPGTDPRAVAQIRAALANGSELDVELTNYRRDGTAFRNRLLLKPLRDAAGAVSHYAGLQHMFGEDA